MRSEREREGTIIYGTISVICCALVSFFFLFKEKTIKIDIIKRFCSWFFFCGLYKQIDIVFARVVYLK